MSRSRAVRPPNVLVLMADQLSAQFLPTYGSRVVSAPRLTRLARESVVFDSAYCAAPLCGPARSSLLTGQRPSRIGAYDNATELAAAVPTLGHSLRAAGYRTTLAGKMHFVGPDQLHGFEERLTPDIYPAGFDWTPDWRRPMTDRLPWYHNMDSVLEAGTCVTGMQLDFDDEVAFRSVRHLQDLARSPGGEPFCMVVSFSHPHDPWELRSAHWDLYDPRALDLPRVGTIPREQADPHSLRLRDMYGVDEAGLTDEQVRNARHGYYAAVSFVDEKVGQLLDTLDSTGLADDTVVVFLSDHGEMLGERGLWYKMSFFEPAMRVPLFLRIPGTGARRVARSVSTTDLVPTLLDLTAGASGRDGGELPSAALDLDGSSLLPLVDAPTAARRPVIGEYLAEGVVAPAVMVREGRYKYVQCPGDPEQLFDVAADPDERVDLAGAPAHAARLEALRAEVEQRYDLAELSRQVLASQAQRRAVAAALAVGRDTPWDYRPEVDPGGRYVRSRTDLYELQRRARLDAGPAEPAGEGEVAPGAVA